MPLKIGSWGLPTVSLESTSFFVGLIVNMLSELWWKPAAWWSVVVYFCHHRTQNHVKVRRSIRLKRCHWVRIIKARIILNRLREYRGALLSETTTVEVAFASFLNECLLIISQQVGSSESYLWFHLNDLRCFLMLYSFLSKDLIVKLYDSHTLLWFGVWRLTVAHGCAALVRQNLPLTYTCLDHLTTLPLRFNPIGRGSRASGRHRSYHVVEWNLQKCAQSATKFVT